ncbi:hypothetical protein GGR58DRAFT_519513 [Xylaria digitata]|nr:hypothetical protein GGR58DRAFT_519513 [Xylaria digitata]
MANMTADIEQLLAELVRITTKIAALANAANASTSDDSDSLTSTANRLALSATIIAVAAFLISSLQAILEYSSAGESARRKCDSAAIGPFSKHVHKRWSFRIRPAPFLQSRPRATWAQLFSVSNFRYSELIVPGIYVDVDSIPGSLDVLPKMFDLVELGKRALEMGFDSVTLNVQGRHFKAIGEFGSITTEELTGFGKLIRFQAYTSDQQPWQTSVLSYGSPFSIEGEFKPHAYSPTRVFLSSEEPYVLHMRSEANHMVSVLDEAIQSDIGVDNIYDAVNAISNESMQTATARWQNPSALVSYSSKYPSILITLAIAELPYRTLIFPGRSLLFPFLGQFRLISQALYEPCKEALSDIPFEDKMLKGLNYQKLFAERTHWSFDTIESFWAPLETELRRGLVREWRVILPLIIDLIKDFDPRLWAQDFRERESSSTDYRWEASDKYGPYDLLKIQIVLLDISIFSLLDAMRRIHGKLDALRSKIYCPETLIWRVQEAVLKSVTNSTDFKPELFDNLDLALPSHPSTEPEARAIYQQLVSQIADFLRLRVVLYGAYLMILPDNSGIVEPELSLRLRRILLPMI